MKPPAFEYVVPRSLDEALALRAEHGDESVFLAGGQSLMPLLNLRMSLPSVVIDLGRVAELAGIREHDGGGVAIGAMTRQRDAERSPLVADRCPLMVRALGQVAHVTIRNRGTIGGSLAHADPAAELPAVAVALDAEIVVRSSRGERAIAAADFFRGVMTTAIAPDELLIELRIPAGPADAAVAQRNGVAFVELTRRRGDFALVGVAAVVSFGTGEEISDARLALIGVGGTAVRARAAEAILRRQTARPETLALAAEQAATEIDPGSDLYATAEYRRHMATVLVRRALEEACR